MLRLWLRRLRARSAARLRRGSAVQSGTPTGENATVNGERGPTLAIRTRSLQARMNALLAGALAIGVVGAVLTWYYSRVLHERTEVSERHAVPRQSNPVGVPPPLGAIPVPRPIAPALQDAGSLPAPAIPLAALARWTDLQPAHPPTDAVLSRPQRMPPARERRFAGAVLIRAASAARAPARRSAGRTSPGHRGDLARRGSSGSRLQALLRPTRMSATRAYVLPQQRLLLPKGTFIDCTLETAIDSTLPGMTICITSTDTFSADGTVVLLPRGTLLIGQTRGEVRQGMARVFVIWTQARTPGGVIVRLDSPATDALGRSGLTGTVERHFWQRFGAALMVSTLTGLVQSQVQRSANAVIFDPSAGENVLADTLRGTEDIPPTIEVPNGQRIEVLVARDVDFRSVYALRSH
ncbi:MAG: conjugal transfer protein TrbI [Pseudomonadota bacterium]|nr:conjugal transfer protein TrbI [Pseudomonadota bacterium]